MHTVPAPDEGFRRFDGAPLAFLEAGQGDAVLLVHGSLTDARYWLRSGLLERLARGRRVVAPSRRHNHPNAPSDTGGYDARADAADLLALIDALGLAPVHLVGHSYGAYAALLATLEAPARVRSLVLAEPPIVRWLSELPRGEGIWERFSERVWEPLGAAFRDGGDAAGLERTARWYFGTSFEEIEPSWQQAFRDSVREWRALATSEDAFPYVPLARLATMATPTLVLSGGRNAGGMNDVIDEALAATIPSARRVVVPDAGHEMFLDAPEGVAEALEAAFAAA